MAGRAPGGSRDESGRADDPGVHRPRSPTMKLKRLPEDFQVEELPLVAGGDRGRFAFYRLTKRGMGTLEAIEAICRRWNLAGPSGQLRRPEGPARGHGPVPDDRRRARPGAARDELRPRAARPARAARTARRSSGATGSPWCSATCAEPRRRAAVAALAELPRDGLPNYFDDQRFGSVGFGGGFIAQAWLAGDHERALRLALAEPNPSDRPGTKAEKAILRECWGRWPEAKARLERSHARSLVTYLADHPTDFRGAFARLRRELRSLYFSAFQSHLWNLMLGALDRADRPGPSSGSRSTSRSPRCRSTAASTPTRPRRWPAAGIPLPVLADARCPRARSATVAREVLEPLGLAWEDLRVKHLKDVFFSKGTRPALFFAGNLTHAVDRDELHPGRRKLRLDLRPAQGGLRHPGRQARHRRGGLTRTS